MCFLVFLFVVCGSELFGIHLFQGAAQAPVAHPLMELDRPHRGFGLKVGHNVAEVHAGHLAQPCLIAT